jgi:hypothetical protein
MKLMPYKSFEAFPFTFVPNSVSPRILLCGAIIHKLTASWKAGKLESWYYENNARFTRGAGARDEDQSRP